MNKSSYVEEDERIEVEAWNEEIFFFFFEFCNFHEVIYIDRSICLPERQLHQASVFHLNSFKEITHINKECV